MKNIILACTLIIGANDFLLAQDWEEMIKVAAPNRKADDQFGFSISMSGDYAIIGAYRHDFDENESDSLLDAGAVYVFQRNSCDWTFVQKLVASDRDTNDFFGYITDIEGDYALIGAFQADEDEIGNNFQANAGAVYVFRNVGGVWNETQKLVASERLTEDNFGLSLAMSGEYAVIGAYREDEDEDDMNTIPGAGSAYVFQNTGGTWSQVQKIVATVREANDNFGISVAIEDDHIVVGAYSEDHDVDEMNFLSNAGSAYIFLNSGGLWSQIQKIVNADRATFDRFGQSVSISGQYIVCGAPLEDEDDNGMNTLSAAGSAYVYKDTSGWYQLQKIVPEDRAASDNFGNWVVIEGEFVLVSSYREDEDCNLINTLTDAGSAYMFENLEDTLSQYQKICRADRDAGDFFSFRVALDGNLALISSHLDDQNEQDMDSLNNAGSAYFFSLGECIPQDLDIISVQDGNWNDPGTWDCACVPDTTDRVQILTSHSVSVTDNQGCDSLIVDDGGRLNVFDTLVVHGGAVFSDTVYVESVLMGDGDKLIQDGGVLLTSGILAGSGELEIADGGELSFQAFVENQFYLTIRNHGTINMNAGYYTNSACGALSTIINEADGEFNLGGDQFHFLAKMNIVNYGEINVNTETRFNYGCEGDNGYFNNISPGVVNVINGILYLHGDGTHSGLFNVNSHLAFNADMNLTTNGNVTGAGVLSVYDTTTINIPYTFAIDSIINGGNITGSGDKTLPSGAHLVSSGVLSGTGELIIEDGATLTLPAFPENNFCLDITNHGTIRWSSGYYTNSLCDGLSNLVNASDGEFIIDGNLGRFFSNTNVTNYGVITKNEDFGVSFGAEGFFNNISPGVININAGEISLNGNGTHSGAFNNSGILAFNANHTLTTPNNITGTGDIVIYDTLEINIPFTFPAAEITLYGVLHGMDDKSLPSGSVLNMYNTCDFHSELVIEDGAVLNYSGVFIGDTIRNHGVFNWVDGNINACRGELATFYNEMDGEIVIPVLGYRFLSRTNLINYGSITKTGDWSTTINGGCGDDGYFNNVNPGVVTNANAMGAIVFSGEGIHSGVFQNTGVMVFNADHVMTTANNLNGTGDIQILDTMIIDLPYTFPATDILLNGTMIGTDDKTLPSGSILHMNNTWEVGGELHIQDGAILNYSGVFIGDTIRNHGIFNWIGGDINACRSELAMFYNEIDGEIAIPVLGYRFLSRTNLINYGSITKTGDWSTSFNAGCGDDGYFNNISPGSVSNANALGAMGLYGDGTHSGAFNNDGILVFSADHELISSTTISGTGEWHIHDTSMVSTPLTIGMDSTVVYGVLNGTGDLSLPSGKVMTSIGPLVGSGDLTIQDGGTLHFMNGAESYFSNPIFNHGLVTWNTGQHMNPCSPLTSFTNHSDGEFRMGGTGDRYFANTDLINYGLITKNTPASIYINYDGSCVGFLGDFDNIGTGMLKVLDGTMIIR